MSNHDRHGSRPANGDAELERAWRDASDEQPPSHLDAAIIAAARKSVPEDREQPSTAPARIQSRSWLTRWQPLAAAATVAGLAFVLVQMLPREHALAPSMPYEESAPAPASAEPQPQPQNSSARGTTYHGQAPGVVADAESREQVAVPEQAPLKSEVLVPPPAPPAITAKATAGDTAATADTAAAPGETSTDRRQAVEPELAGRAAPAAAAVSSSRARERDLGIAAPPDPAAWVARIVALHGSGDVLAAEDALRAFRAAEPGANSYLPDSLREWARTVE